MKSSIAVFLAGSAIPVSKHGMLSMTAGDVVPSTPGDPIVFGGSGGSATAAYQYDGSVWNTLSNYPANNARSGGIGGFNAGLSAGGGYSNASYEYTGSSDSWGSDIGLSYSANLLGSGGTVNSALVWGGTSTGSDEQSTTAECLDTGAGWANVGNLPAALMHSGGNGDSDAAVSVAGALTGHVKQNGCSTWSGATDSWASSSTNYPISVDNNAYAGSVDDGVGWGGHDGTSYGLVNNSYSLTGETWAAVGNYPTVVYGTSRAGIDESEAIGAGGENATSGAANYITSAYLYDGATNTWGALGANLPTGRGNTGSDGEVP